jgi:hypothetical protein
VEVPIRCGRRQLRQGAVRAAGQEAFGRQQQQAYLGSRPGSSRSPALQADSALLCVVAAVEGLGAAAAVVGWGGVAAGAAWRVAAAGAQGGGGEGRVAGGAAAAGETPPSRHLHPCHRGCYGGR